MGQPAQPQQEEAFDLEVWGRVVGNPPMPWQHRAGPAAPATPTRPPTRLPGRHPPSPLPLWPDAGLCRQLLWPRTHLPPALCRRPERGQAAGAGGVEAGGRRAEAGGWPPFRQGACCACASCPAVGCLSHERTSMSVMRRERTAIWQHEAQHCADGDRGACRLAGRRPCLRAGSLA